MRSRTTREARWVGALGVIVVLLAGCASIPTSGPVREGTGVISDRGGQVTRALARPPVDGMSDVWRFPR